MTSPYWCPPSSPRLSPVSSEIWLGRARDTNIGDSRFNATQKQQSRPGAEVIAGDFANCIQRPFMSRAVIINTSPFKYMDGQMDPFKAEQTISFIDWVQVKHLSVSKLIIIDSYNGLVPGLHQAIVWTKAGITVNSKIRSKLQGNLKQISHIFIQENVFEIVVCEIPATLSRFFNM